MAANGPIEIRFWAKIDKSDGCWIFIGYRCKIGYGRICFRGNPHWLTHRVSWILANGDIPEGMNVLHRCDNPPCCNPDHLFLGTQADNVRDRDAKGRGRLPGIKGEDHWHSKLTENDVLSIRASLEKGAKQRDLCKVFGVNSSTISDIKARKLWAHV